MQTIKIAQNVYADFNKIGNDIEIVKVYRGNGHTFPAEASTLEWAKSTIRAVQAGWMKIK